MRKRIFTTMVLASFSGITFASSGGAESGSLLSWEMFFKGSNFIILLFLLYKFARKPIAKMLSSSAEESKKTVDSARSELEDTQKQLADYKRKIANLEQELEKRLASSLAAIEEEKKQIIIDAENQTKKFEEQTQSRIEQNIQNAKSEIRKYLVSESVKLAEKTISDQISSKEQKAQIDNYTKSLKETA